MSARDLYTVLGVPRDANNATIRRAYKDMCLRLHPDKQPAGAQRNAAEAQFKEICAAYEVLSEPSSRAAHDAELRRSTGAAASFSSMTSSSSSPFENEEYRRKFAADFEKKMRSEGEMPLDGEELFSALFGERRAQFRFESREKAPDREIPLPLTLEELHTGSTKRRKLQRQVRDEEGALQPTITVLRIDVKPGYRPGDRIRFRNAGSESDEYRAPDVVFVIQQKDHPRFSRKSDDLLITLPIHLSEALTGVNTKVIGIDGEEIEVVVEDSVAKPGDTHVIQGKGLARRGSPNQRGDLIVRFDVQFPDRLLPAERRALKDVLGRVAHREARPAMRRTASMFTARGREFSDVSRGDEEPKSTGRRAFQRSSTPPETVSRMQHQVPQEQQIPASNPSSTQLPTSATSTSSSHRYSRDGPRVNRKESGAVRKESGAGVRKNSENTSAASGRGYGGIGGGGGSERTIRTPSPRKRDNKSKFLAFFR